LTGSLSDEIEGLGQNPDEPLSDSATDGDQAERCDGNLPFASRLMALLSMTDHWAGQAFVEGETPFPGSSNGGFWPKKVKNALSFNGG
jgi:hypothetical protein